MNLPFKHIASHALTALLFSAAVAISQAATPGGDHNGHQHHKNAANSESITVTEQNPQATVEDQAVHHRVRVGPSSKARFVLHTADTSGSTIKPHQAPDRTRIGPPSKSRGRKR